MRKFLPVNRNSISRLTKYMLAHCTRVKQKFPEFRNHHSSSVIRWWEVLWNGATAIYFCMPEVKTTTKIYEETIFKSTAKPLNDTLFKGQCWIFQEDSAPAHKSKCCQELLANNIPTFIRVDWISGSPYLNPLDYELWDFWNRMYVETPFKSGVA